MKKIILPILTFLIIAACDDANEMNTTIPSCIQAMADESGDYPFYTLQMQVIGNQPHYWLNTGAMVVDGREYIINSNCDTVCHFCGFCVPPDCFDDYDQEGWEIIWE